MRSLARLDERERRGKRRSKVLNRRSTHQLSRLLSGLTVIGTRNKERHVQGSIVAYSMRSLNRSKVESREEKARRLIIDRLNMG